MFRNFSNFGSFASIATIIMIAAEIFANIIIFGTIIIVIKDAIKRNKSRNYFKNNVVYSTDHLQNLRDNHNKNIYKDVQKDKLAMFNTDDINSLKDYFYDIFYQFETAYNSLDYNMMKTLSTKQLYQNYYTGITLDLKTGRKKIIENIKRKNVIIYELDSTIAKQTLSAMIEVSYVTYTLNRGGFVISGKRYDAVTEKFEVTFRKDFEKEDVTKCPNCGAVVTGNKCSYCRTTLKNVEFKISSIKKII